MVSSETRSSLVGVLLQRANNLRIQLGVFRLLVTDNVQVRLGRIEFAIFATIQTHVPVIIEIRRYCAPHRAKLPGYYAAL